MKKIGLFLGITQVVIAAGAIPAGLSMIIEPGGTSLGISTEMLSESPFDNFFIPGLLLCIVNGLFNAIGAILSFKKNRYAGFVGLSLGIFLILWICFQVYFVGLIHILQPLFFVIGVFELMLGYKLHFQKNRKMDNP